MLLYLPAAGSINSVDNNNSTTTTKMITIMQPKTTTRSQRVNNILAQPLPTCSSEEYKNEYYKVMWMLRELINCGPREVREIWMMNLLTEAMTELQSLNDPTSTPLDSRKEDNRKWTEIMVRRIMAEHLWEEDEDSISFYDCYDALREGRSKALQVRLYDQVRTCWETVTGTDLSTSFSLRT